LEMSDGDVRLIDTFETLCRTLTLKLFISITTVLLMDLRRLRHCKLTRA